MYFTHSSHNNISTTSANSEAVTENEEADTTHKTPQNRLAFPISNIYNKTVFATQHAYH